MQNRKILRNGKMNSMVNLKIVRKRRGDKETSRELLWYRDRPMAKY